MNLSLKWPNIRKYNSFALLSKLAFDYHHNYYMKFSFSKLKRKFQRCLNLLKENTTACHHQPCFETDHQFLKQKLTHIKLVLKVIATNLKDVGHFPQRKTYKNFSVLESTWRYCYLGVSYFPIRCSCLWSWVNMYTVLPN